MSRRHRTRLAAIGLASLCLGWAQSDGRAEALRHYQRALGLVDDGGYAEAVVEFRRAYELAPHHTVLYNLGLAYVALGKPVEAIDTLRRYLAEGGAAIPGERRAQVEEEIRRQATRVATLTVEANVAGATIQVDGVAVGKSHLSAPVRVGIGVHQVAAALPGYQRAEQSVTVAGEEQRLVNLVLLALATTESVESARSSPAPPGTDGRRMLGYASGALGLSAGAAAVGLYLWNRARYDRWNATDERLFNNPDTANFAEQRRANDDLGGSIRRVSVITGWTGVAAGVLLTTGIVLLATSRKHASTTGEPVHALGVGPGFALFSTLW